MTDWQDAVIVMKANRKKRRVKKTDKPSVGLRCWDCGMYLDNLGTGHYCTRCFVKKLKIFMNVPSETNETEDTELPEEEEVNDDECNDSD